MILIQAFDPGQTTGHCWLLLSPKLKTITYSTTNLTQLPQIWLHLNMASFDGIWPHDRYIVQCESFHLYPHRAAAKIGSSFPEIEVIGVIKLFQQLNEAHVEFVERPASMVKNAKIPLDYQRRGMSLHEKDALKHALLCVRSHLKLNIADWKVSHSRDIIGE